jgi:hypothetical protein
VRYVACDAVLDQDLSGVTRASIMVPSRLKLLMTAATGPGFSRRHPPQIVWFVIPCKRPIAPTRRSRSKTVFTDRPPARLDTLENQLFSTNPSDEMLYELFEMSH